MAARGMRRFDPAERVVPERRLMRQLRNEDASPVIVWRNGHAKVFCRAGILSTHA
jgi:hypothetical protein